MAGRRFRAAPPLAQARGHRQRVDPVAEVRRGLCPPQPHEVPMPAELEELAGPRGDQPRVAQPVQGHGGSDGDADVPGAEHVVEREGRGDGEDVAEEREAWGRHYRRVLEQAVGAGQAGRRERRGQDGHHPAVGRDRQQVDRAAQPHQRDPGDSGVGRHEAPREHVGRDVEHGVIPGGPLRGEPERHRAGARHRDQRGQHPHGPKPELREVGEPSSRHRHRQDAHEEEHDHQHESRSRRPKESGALDIGIWAPVLEVAPGLAAGAEPPEEGSTQAVRLSLSNMDISATGESPEVGKEVG